MQVLMWEFPICMISVLQFPSTTVSNLPHSSAWLMNPRLHRPRLSLRRIPCPAPYGPQCIMWNQTSSFCHASPTVDRQSDSTLETGVTFYPYFPPSPYLRSLRLSVRDHCPFNHSLAPPTFPSPFLLPASFDLKGLGYLNLLLLICVSSLTISSPKGLD